MKNLKVLGAGKDIEYKRLKNRVHIDEIPGLPG